MGESFSPLEINTRDYWHWSAEDSDRTLCSWIPDIITTMLQAPKLQPSPISSVSTPPATSSFALLQTLLSKRRNWPTLTLLPWIPCFLSWRVQPIFTYSINIPPLIIDDGRHLYSFPRVLPQCLLVVCRRVRQILHPQWQQKWLSSYPQQQFSCLQLKLQWFIFHTF